MDNVLVLHSRLSKNFGTIKEMIKIENSSNNFALNLILESRMLEVYNLIYGTSLTNSNIEFQNFPGVDGIDPDKKIMVQVTSTFSLKKITDTIDRINSHKLYTQFEKLVFIFLSDKKKIKEEQKRKILSKIQGNFTLDFREGMKDFTDFYRFLSAGLDLEKTHKVLSLLDEVLNYLPDNKKSGFNAMAVCFDEEEISNAYLVVSEIIKNGMNVYINSKTLYDRFKSASHPNADYIIYSDPSLNLNNISFCIALWSNSFVKKNFTGIHPTCHLFNYAVQNDLKIENISFDRFVLKVKTDDPRLKAHLTVTNENVPKVIKDILSLRTRAAVFSSITPEAISQELINTHQNFRYNKIHESQEYILLNFVMEHQDDVELNYLILNRDYNLTKIIAHYNEFYRQKFKKNLNILVFKDFDQKTKRRLENVKNVFNNQKVYYIDEHLFDKGYKTFPQQPILTTTEFVTPVFMHNAQFLGINDIIHWVYNNSDSSVAIISGSGGIGKTTISEKIHDTIIEDNERTIVIFIDAQQYINVFRKKSVYNNSEYDLYNIFKMCHPHASIINKDSFYLNYALGNIIIIFDGVDEIVSTIPSFSLHQFIENLEKLRLSMGRGKIILNCRDSYIKDLIKYYEAKREFNDEIIKIYELMGFNEDLAKILFAKYFESLSDQKACLKLMKEIYPDDNKSEYRYPPFILEIIVEIVKDGYIHKEINTEFTSLLLQPEELNDVVIFRICNREIIKKEENGFQLDIDKQVHFFCYLAIEEKGSILSEGFDRILSKIKLIDRLDEITNGLRDHPILIKFNEEYKFRFDFFTTYFKAVGIYNLLCNSGDFDVTEKVISVLANDCNFNSVLYKTLLTKLANSKKSIQPFLLGVRKLIIRIKAFESIADLKLLERIKIAVSNILLIVFKLYGNEATRQILTTLCSEFDHDEELIKDFYFLNVPSTADVVIDFKGLIFSRSQISDYSYFFKCDFDNGTFFDETCSISNVYNSKINTKNISADKNNFDKKISGDNSIFRILSAKDGITEISQHFKAFLKSFYSNRLLSRSKNLKEMNVLLDQHITVEMLAYTLEKNNILKKLEQEVVLNMKFDSRIIKFLSQAMPFSELKSAMRDLEDMLLSEPKVLESSFV